MNLGNDFDFKTDVSKTFGTSAQALSSRQAIGTGALIKAFHDVDERRRMAMGQAFENGVCAAAIAKQFEVPERKYGRGQRIID
jgi:hypothetical protein